MIDKILNKKGVYFILALGLIIYSVRSQLILNSPKYIFWVLFFISFVALAFLEIKKEVKTKKTALDYFLVLLSVSFFSILIALFLKIPINQYIIYKSNKEILVRKCKISNYISGRSERLLFYFDDKIYTLGFENSNHLSRQDIMDHYILHLEYSQSVLNTSVVKKYQIEKK